MLCIDWKVKTIHDSYQSGWLKKKYKDFLLSDNDFHEESEVLGRHCQTILSPSSLPLS